MHGGIFEGIIGKLEQLMAQGWVASRLTGTIAPFQPSVIPLPPGQSKANLPARIQAALDPGENAIRMAKGDTWPILDGGVDWLLQQEWLTPEQIDELKKSGSIFGREAVADLGKAWGDYVTNQLAESVKVGESADEWAKRAESITDRLSGNMEIMQRTAMHRAYHEGYEKILDDPDVGTIFEYRLYQATMDNRTRKAHAAMNGKTAKVGTPLHNEMEALVSQIGCRCTVVAITQQDVKDGNYYVPQDRTVA